MITKDLQDTLFRGKSKQQNNEYSKATAPETEEKPMGLQLETEGAGGLKGTGGGWPHRAHPCYGILIA